MSLRLTGALLLAACLVPIGESVAATVAYAAGDIAECGSPGARRTADLIGPDAQVVFAVGDLAYPSGTPAEFRDCWEPAWGRFRTKLMPVPGNHEYRTPGAAGYFGWFGSEVAGSAERPWYRRDLPGWRVLGLDTNLRGDAADRQLAWLQNELRQAAPACTLALMHHPRFSSGKHGDSRHVDSLWRAMAALPVDVLLTGHDHHYERFAPMDGAGRARSGGTRSFVVGAGGARLYAVEAPRENSDFRDAGRWGVLRLELDDGRYRWEYRVDGGAVIDRGVGECAPAHGANPDGGRAS